MSVFRGFIFFVWDIAKVVIVSLIIILPIRAFVIQPFTVKGASMQPNLNSGDYLFVNEIGYRLSNPKRGDVVIFHPPIDSSQFYIKRIIGLPGERVKIENGKVFISDNDFAALELTEEYVSGFTSGLVDVALKEGEYFVLGDNRNASSDSRKWGALPESNIIGRAWIRAWPFSGLSAIERPEY